MEQISITYFKAIHICYEQKVTQSLRVRKENKHMKF